MTLNFIIIGSALTTKMRMPQIKTMAQMKPHVKQPLLDPSWRKSMSSSRTWTSSVVSNSYQLWMQWQPFQKTAWSSFGTCQTWIVNMLKPPRLKTFAWSLIWLCVVIQGLFFAQPALLTRLVTLQTRTCSSQPVLRASFESGVFLKPQTSPPTGPLKMARIIV